MHRVYERLLHWFAENNIPTDSLTVILNFRDRNAAAHFDMALRRSLDPITDQITPTLDLREFELMGIKTKIESPLHPHKE